MTKIQILLIIYLIPSTTFALNTAPWVGTTFKGLPCQGLGSGYGPYDYINPAHKHKMPIVESYHFTREVENHTKGKSGSIAGDLDYTLRAIPNHHKALLSTIRYQLKLNNNLLQKKKKLLTPIECYLQRGINFNPKDVGTLALYAYYLKKLKRYNKSEKIFQKALEIEPDNTKIQYTYSLLLIKLKLYEKALELAQKVYKKKGAPIALKKQLIKLDIWKEK